jgi:hypothetical protein
MDIDLNLHSAYRILEDRRVNTALITQAGDFERLNNVGHEILYLVEALKSASYLHCPLFVV